MSGRSLWPREHGAYVQLAVPTIAAVVTRPTLAAVGLMLAAGLMFGAGEPLRVALGNRGRRARERDGRRATTRAIILAGAAAAIAVASLARAPIAVPAAVAVALAGAVAVAFVARRAEHTLAGELAAAIALSGAAAPILVVGGCAPADALAVWAAWAVGFGATVATVHRVIARHKRSATLADRLVAVFPAAACAACVVVAPIAVPLTAASAIVTAMLPPASRLRALGFCFAGSAVVAGIVAYLMRS